METVDLLKHNVTPSYYSNQIKFNEVKTKNKESLTPCIYNSEQSDIKPVAGQD